MSKGFSQEESDLSSLLLSLIVVTRNGKILWKHGTNWPFYALMFKTKLYQNPSFFTMYQNINKTKKRGLFANPYFTILCDYCQLFFFFLSRCKQAGANCAIIGCNFSKKSQTSQIISFLLIFCQERPVKQLGDRHSDTIEMASQLVHVFCDFKTT